MPATAFDKYWAECVQKNVGLLDEEARMNLSVAQLKSNMRKAYEAGQQQAREESRKAAGPNPFGNPFSKIFGG